MEIRFSDSFVESPGHPPSCLICAKSFCHTRVAPQVHDVITEAGGYPSPLNYFNFPKSVCTSVNEVRAPPRAHEAGLHLAADELWTPG